MAMDHGVSDKDSCLWKNDGSDNGNSAKELKSHTRMHEHDLEYLQNTSLVLTNQEHRLINTPLVVEQNLC